MATLISERGVPAWKRRLTLPTYQVGDAARYAQISGQTILNWQKSASETQAIADRSKGAPLSYMQLVEVAFVAALRHAGVSLSQIKNARQYLAQQFGSQYPFAEHRFMTDGKDLWKRLTDFDSKQSSNVLVKLNKGGQTGWRNFVETKFTEFKYEDDIAVQWHVAGPKSPVLIDPRVSFGAPTVKGVATWAIKGRFDSGESLEDIAEDFVLEKKDVQSALKFEGVDLSTLKAWQ